MTFSRKIQLSIPAEAEFIDVVRLTLYGVASRMGFTFEEIEDMKVAIAEACNNAVVHGYENSPAGRVNVELEQVENGLCIRVKDSGNQFDANKAVSEADSLHNKQLEEIHEGGLGIYLMQALMDEVEVNSDQGTEVVMRKFLVRSEEKV